MGLMETGTAAWARTRTCAVALAELVRLRNAGVGAGYTILGAYLVAGGPGLRADPTLRAALVVFLVVAAGNVINDYRDAAADAVAKPGRPIPSGRVSRRAAGGFFLGLALTAAIVALSLGWLLGGLGLTMIVVSIAYSYLLKGIALVGNATVGLLCGGTLLYGALAADTITAGVGWASAMTFAFVFAQEVLYTVEDEDGDRRSQVHTTATRLGTAASLRVFKGLAALFVLIALAPWLSGKASDLYLCAVVPGVIVPTLGVVVLVGRPLSALSIDRASRLSRVVWFSSVGALALLR